MEAYMDEDKLVEAEGNEAAVGEPVASDAPLAATVEHAPTFLIERAHKSHIVVYVCYNERCKAEDHVGFFDGESVPLVINCWRCHNGQGLAVDQMLAEKKGMFPRADSEAQRNEQQTKARILAQAQHAVNRSAGPTPVR